MLREIVLVAIFYFGVILVGRIFFNSIAVQMGYEPIVLNVETLIWLITGFMGLVLLNAVRKIL